MPAEHVLFHELHDRVDLSKVFICNSCFLDDVWGLAPIIPSKTKSAYCKKIDFSYIADDCMKHTVKLYAYHRLGRIKPQSVVAEINSTLLPFIQYYSTNGIIGFNKVTREYFLNFNLWLKDTKKMTAKYGYDCSAVIEKMIKVGQIKGWNVPTENIFAGLSSHQLWQPNKHQPKNRTKPIPENVLGRILHHAIHDETSILTKAAIIIQSQTGLRISEVLSICEGCVHNQVIDGVSYSYMEVALGKTEKGEPINHKVFINDLVRSTIAELSEETKTLRNESGLREMFISYYHGNACVLTVNAYMKRIPQFIKRWNILDNKGNLYPLTSHQFRATYVRELVKKKIPIADIMEQFSHVSIEMTAHYLTLQEEEVKEIYSDMILSPDSKIAGLRAKEIRGKLDNLYRGKTEPEVDQVISELATTMSFNPMPTGICLYDFRRGNCTDGDGCFFYNCPNYITEVRFHPILKAELDLMEKEMNRLKSLGRERDWQRHYVKWMHLAPLVKSLEEQIHAG